MNALDTNALIRFLVRDDERQAQIVRSIILDAEQNGTPLFIPLVVSLETIWVLSSAYKYSKEEIVRSLESALKLSALEFEARERLNELCNISLHMPCDLPDILIGLSARDAGCETTFTFDKKAARSQFFRLLDQELESYF